MRDSRSLKFSPRNFIVLALQSISSYFFVCGMRSVLRFNFLYIQLLKSSYKNFFLVKIILSSLNCLRNFVKSHMCVSLSSLFILLHWSVYLSLCQYHRFYYWSFMSLKYVINVSHPKFFFFKKNQKFNINSFSKLFLLF